VARRHAVVAAVFHHAERVAIDETGELFGELLPLHQRQRHRKREAVLRVARDQPLAFTRW
jgi:hypothetical protein